MPGFLNGRSNKAPTAWRRQARLLNAFDANSAPRIVSESVANNNVISLKVKKKWLPAFLTENSKVCTTKLLVLERDGNNRQNLVSYCSLTNPKKVNELLIHNISSRAYA